LTEHRTPDVLEKLKVAEKEKIEKEKLAYIDPAKAEQEREEGNKLFKVSLQLLPFLSLRIFFAVSMESDRI